MLQEVLPAICCKKLWWVPCCNWQQEALVSCSLQPSAIGHKRHWCHAPCSNCQQEALLLRSLQHCHQLQCTMHHAESGSKTHWYLAPGSLQQLAASRIGVMQHSATTSKKYWCRATCSQQIDSKRHLCHAACTMQQTAARSIVVMQPAPLEAGGTCVMHQAPFAACIIFKYFHSTAFHFACCPNWRRAVRSIAYAYPYRGYVGELSPGSYSFLWNQLLKRYFHLQLGSTYKI